ncbi:MAG: 16S rRNA (cytosine(967)-C(5))-methyltransferase RsmB [Pseudohongiellaceae bacterium]
MSQNPRAVAAEILNAILSHHGSLTSHLQKHESAADFSLVQEMCFGCCRHYYALDAILGQLLERPLRRKDLDVKSLLLVGIYQLRYLRIPDHAAINETVAATGTLNKAWARGLVNGVLRNYVRQADALDQMLVKTDDTVRFSHPGWLLARLKADWPDQWREIAAANNQRPPMTLRVNRLQSTPRDYLDRLRQAGIEARSGTLAETALYLDKPVAVDRLPGFADGRVSVQDEASQLVPGLLRLEAGQSVLDACAAPGGKACHLLESEHSLTRMVLIDKDSSRLRPVQENLMRLHLEAEVKQNDAADIEAWWDQRPFQRILLDAPCTGTGVIRRHPDIRLLRLAQDVPRMADEQLKLLTGVWPCLEPGGLLLYCTCSVLREENDAVVGAFLREVDSAKHEAITADWGVQCRYGRQLLPCDNGTDGFFFSVLRKKPVSA